MDVKILNAADLCFTVFVLLLFSVAPLNTVVFSSQLHSTLQFIRFFYFIWLLDFLILVYTTLLVLLTCFFMLLCAWLLLCVSLKEDCTRVHSASSQPGLLLCQAHVNSALAVTRPSLSKSDWNRYTKLWVSGHQRGPWSLQQITQMTDDTIVTKTVCSTGSQKFILQLSIYSGKRNVSLIGSIGYEIYQAYNETSEVSSRGGNEKHLINWCFRTVPQ